jgi:TonB family protein
MVLASVPTISQQNAQQPSQPAIVQSVPIVDSKPAKKSDEPPACPTKFDDSLETNGIASKIGVGTGITPPKLIHSVEANFSDKARRARKDKNLKQTEFKSIINLVVNKEGNPTDLCLKTATGYDLDREAGKAVREYRFKPAVKDGAPIAVRINVEVNFRFY